MGPPVKGRTQVGIAELRGCRGGQIQCMPEWVRESIVRGKIKKPDRRTERGSRGSVKEVRRDWVPERLANLVVFAMAWEPESLGA